MNGLFISGDGAPKDSVSVVIPAHNRPELLPIAIQSALDQTRAPFEIIVVDDGSEPSLESVALGFVDERIRFIRHAHPKGANAARNTGIRAAIGEYVAFLDDDDRWLPEKTEKQLILIRGNPYVGAVYCATAVIDVGTGVITYTRKRSFPSGQIHRQLLIDDKTGPTPTYLVRRCSFDKVGFFDETLPARQDWDMWTRLSKAYAIMVVPEVLVLQGEHSGERVRNNPTKSIMANSYIYEKYRDDRRAAGFIVQCKAAAVYHATIARLLHSVSRASALKHYALSLLYNPFVWRTYKGLLVLALGDGCKSRLKKVAKRITGFAAHLGRRGSDVSK